MGCVYVARRVGCGVWGLGFRVWGLGFRVLGRETRTPSTRLIKTTLETTQGQIDGFFGQLLFKFHLPEVASVGN